MAAWPNVLKIFRNLIQHDVNYLVKFQSKEHEIYWYVIFGYFWILVPCSLTYGPTVFAYNSSDAVPFISGKYETIGTILVGKKGFTFLFATFDYIFFSTLLATFSKVQFLSCFCEHYTLEAKSQTLLLCIFNETSQIVSLSVNWIQIVYCWNFETEIKSGKSIYRSRQYCESKELQGVPERSIRWKLAVPTIEGALWQKVNVRKEG